VDTTLTVTKRKGLQKKGFPREKKNIEAGGRESGGKNRGGMAKSTKNNLSSSSINQGAGRGTKFAGGSWGRLRIGKGGNMTNQDFARKRN